ncbi:MAG: hypothetical protein US60_C0016G0012 [Microgenomates group bacterium GW2011_GWC1_37_8]|uniref:VOC domain-containing protein n=1 Tax=Candidatus Woesebacteria bacterium GW2011_GWB1_38_8 TaxID=1618570 RepID=A0A0G0LCP5_9BACT|nr:MAG: hypothetical protein US60_C0016G0012 [Microgenomates group bacterium GW2011_GWC1_37_8]KKQ85650.1 MAG: hypothetical protein UT08_C0005G0101 [Candidatus Woesebacteria bacterium GW2011_GWB1_38_8]
MIRKLESVLLFSENAKNLAKFYREKVGLKPTGEFEMGEKKEEVYIYEWKGGSALSILDHSKVKGKNKFPQRFIINLEVDKIDSEIKKLKDAKVKLVQDKYHIEGYGWVATFEDLDGNYFQLVQVRVS